MGSEQLEDKGGKVELLVGAIVCAAVSIAAFGTWAVSRVMHLAELPPNLTRLIWYALVAVIAALGAKLLVRLARRSGRAGATATMIPAVILAGVCVLSIFRAVQPIATSDVSGSLMMPYGVTGQEVRKLSVGMEEADWRSFLHAQPYEALPDGVFRYPAADGGSYFIVTEAAGKLVEVRHGKVLVRTIRIIPPGEVFWVPTTLPTTRPTTRPTTQPGS